MRSDLPSAPNIERAVLATAMLEPRTIDDFLGRITPDDFLDPRHKAIWKACEDIHLGHHTVDLQTVLHRLDATGELRMVGGATYLSELDLELPSIYRVDEYAAILRDQTTRRKMIEAGRQLVVLAREGSIPAIDSLGEVRADLDRLELRTEPGGFRAAPQIVRDHHDIPDREYSDLAGMPSGIVDLDRVTLGFEPGHLWIVAGRPGQGKTALALSISRNLLGIGKTVGIASLEMDERELLQRDAAAISRVHFGKIRTGRMTTEERGQVSNALEQIASLPLHVDDSSSLKTPQLASRCRRLAIEWGLDCLIVDYLQLLEPGKSRESRNLDVADVAMSLRALAKDLRIPVIALAQLSRSSEYRSGKRPSLADLRDSGQIEQDAYGVIFLHREDTTSPVLEVIVAKNRGGAQDTVKVHFDGPRMRFTPLDTRHA